MHVHSENRSGWMVKGALAVTLVLVAVEFIVGTMSHSLALVGDGWHNLADVPSLILASVAIYFERRPPDQRKTYGYQRAGVLTAFVNALLLIAVALFLCYEAYGRILHPTPVATGPMMVVGLVALVINSSIWLGLIRERADLNLRVVFLHNLGDALSNVGIILGAWIIRSTGERVIDPLLALLIVGMIVWTAVTVIADSTNILLESLPKGMSLEEVAGAILTVPGVREVHDVHVWSLGSRQTALSCHVRILDMPTSESERIGGRIRALLESEFHVRHTTIQFEHTHPPGDFHRYMPEPAPAKESD